MNNLLWNLLGNRIIWKRIVNKEKRRSHPMLWRLLSPLLVHFLCGRPPLSQIARFLSFSLLPPVKYNAHCALLDKCNFCDEKPLNVTNMSNDALKYHNMNYLSSVSFPRLSDLCLFPPSPVEQPTLQWYALSLKCYLLVQQHTHKCYKLKESRKETSH